MGHVAGSGYEAALAVDEASPEQHLALACGLLAGGQGIVILDGVIVLRPGPAGIRCEVIDPAPSAHRCEEEFRVLVENAARRLAASRLATRLPRRPLRWLVVECGESGIVELWAAPTGVPM